MGERIDLADRSADDVFTKITKLREEGKFEEAHLLDKELTKQEDALFDRFDSVFSDGRFAEVDLEMRDIDVSKKSSLYLVHTLCACNWAQGMLQSYVEFYRRASEELVGRGESVSGFEPRLKSFLAACWCRETSADPDNWSPMNIAWGQCAVTALVVQDCLKGDIVWANANLQDGREISHYFNKIQMDFYDFTRQQFPDGTRLPIGVPKKKEFSSTREYILSYEATRTRYDLLKDKVDALAGQVNLKPERSLGGVINKFLLPRPE